MTNPAQKEIPEKAIVLAMYPDAWCVSRRGSDDFSMAKNNSFNLRKDALGAGLSEEEAWKDAADRLQGVQFTPAQKVERPKILSVDCPRCRCGIGSECLPDGPFWNDEGTAHYQRDEQLLAMEEWCAAEIADLKRQLGEAHAKIKAMQIAGDELESAGSKSLESERWKDAVEAWDKAAYAELAKQKEVGSE